MGYCTITDIKDLIGLTNWNSLANSHTDPSRSFDDVVNSEIESASSFIDSHIMGRYEVPLTRIPATIRDVSAVITIYRLYLRAHQAEQVPDVKQAYADAVKYLEKIRNKEADLPLNEQSVGASGEYRVEPRRFIMDFMKGF